MKTLILFASVICVMNALPLQKVIQNKYSNKNMYCTFVIANIVAIIYAHTFYLFFKIARLV